MPESVKKPQIVFGQELIMDEEKHAYTWGGAFVPGVTSILKVIHKPELIGWYIKITRDYWLEAVKAGRKDFAKIHKESWKANQNVSKSAQDIGKNVHAYAECVLKNQKLPKLLTDEAKRSAEAFHKWHASHKIKVFASERMVFSKEHYFAGTCDLLAEIDGMYCVVDFKTSSGFYKETRLQLAAYQQAIQEETGVRADARWEIRFDKKTGNFETKTFYDFELDFSGFKSALELHRVLQKIAG